MKSTIKLPRTHIMLHTLVSVLKRTLSDMFKKTQTLRRLLVWLSYCFPTCWKPPLISRILLELARGLAVVSPAAASPFPPTFPPFAPSDLPLSPCPAWIPRTLPFISDPVGCAHFLPAPAWVTVLPTEDADTFTWAGDAGRGRGRCPLVLFGYEPGRL